LKKIELIFFLRSKQLALQSLKSAPSYFLCEKEKVKISSQESFRSHSENRKISKPSSSNPHNTQLRDISRIQVFISHDVIQKKLIKVSAGAGIWGAVIYF